MCLIKQKKKLTAVYLFTQLSNDKFQKISQIPPSHLTQNLDIRSCAEYFTYKRITHY